MAVFGTTDGSHGNEAGHRRGTCAGLVTFRPVWKLSLRADYPQLLRHFGFSIYSPTNPWTVKSYVFMLIQDMQVTITRRA